MHCYIAPATYPRVSTSACADVMLFALSHRAGTRCRLKGSVQSLPIWSCSVWGLPCRWCYHQRGGLLPRRFTLTAPSLRLEFGGLFSVALAVRWSCDHRPGRYPAHCPAEFGLSSPLRRLRREGQRSSGRLHCLSVAARGRLLNFEDEMGAPPAFGVKSGADWS